MELGFSHSCSEHVANWLLRRILLVIVRGVFIHLEFQSKNTLKSPYVLADLFVASGLMSLVDNILWSYVGLKVFLWTSISTLLVWSTMVVPSYCAGIGNGIQHDPFQKWNGAVRMVTQTLDMFTHSYLGTSVVMDNCFVLLTAWNTYVCVACSSWLVWLFERHSRMLFINLLDIEDRRFLTCSVARKLWPNKLIVAFASIPLVWQLATIAAVLHSKF